MVVTLGETTREAIGKRLGQALDKLTIPERGRSAWLAARLRSRVQVTHQAARKWLEGESVPDLDKLCLIALELGVSLDWLATGRGPMSCDDLLAWPFSPELHARYMALSNSQRVQVQAALHSRIIEMEESDAARARPKNPRSAPVIVMNQVRNQRAGEKKRKR